MVQTLLRPSKQARAQAPAPVSHRKPRTPRRGRPDGARNGVWALSGLLVLFLLSLVAGAILAVHGASGSSSASAGGPVTLTPERPSASSATEARTPSTEAGPVQGPVKIAEPAAPGRGPAKKPKSPAATKKITLRPGDTLYVLAGSHGTTVKTLQRLNELGTSTLIYAGETLRLPIFPGQDRAKTAPPTSPAPSSGDKTRKQAVAQSAPRAVIAFARAQVGKPYVWGGTGPRGYDCSGLVMRAWERAGVRLPRTTWSQIHAGKATTRAKLVPGDLVITASGGHVQLYIGDGKVIHAPRPGRTVTVTQLADPSQVVSYRHITP
ncbi:C40 family peptidase [Streptomyces sp. NPDC058394]|uniref:C40 family peptidase n=1 Tax=Streptomyces sp. NPDC058394 TaxID=3346477 RepID=UPI00366840F3